MLPHNRDEFRLALMLGLAQSPVKTPTKDALTSVSLLAARNRYKRPSVPPASSADRPNPTSETALPALLPDTARSALIRLFTGKDANAGDGIAIASVRAIKRAGFRLHPFDYSRLEDLIARFADELGRPEQQWLGKIRPDRQQTDKPYDDTPVTEETLPAASKAQKLAYLRNIRQGDPSRARSLIETLMPNEPANVRADLVGLLAVKLGQDDKSFLERLSADRAQTVREGAERLLARLPGTEAYRKKLERARDQIEIKKTGLLKRRSTLSLRVDPKTNAMNPLFNAMETHAELFHGIRLADLAASLEMTVDELIAGSAQSIDLDHLVLKCALLEDTKVDLDLFSTLFTGDGGGTALFLLKDVIPSTTGSMRNMLLERALSFANWSVLPSPHFFEQVYDLLREPLPVPLAVNLLKSSIWRDALHFYPNGSRPHWVQSAAPLIPRALSEDFIRDAEPHSRRAALYHRFLLALPEQPQ
ncbi:MAG: hypothetical protein JNJ53_13740 [Rhizobiales bacterium]|nr:hypothetical protein [Hyphomicrobiales bacterium]